MTDGTLSRVLAGCFALSAFAVAVIAGLAAQSGSMQILTKALVAMALCYPVGLIVGLICERVVNERIAEHQRENPLPAPEGERVSDAPSSASPATEEVIEV